MIRCEELEELTGISEAAVSGLMEKFHKRFDQIMLPEQSFQAPRIPKQLLTKSAGVDSESHTPTHISLPQKQYSASKQIFGNQEKECDETPMSSTTTRETASFGKSIAFSKLYN